MSNRNNGSDQRHHFSLAPTMASSGSNLALNSDVGSLATVQSQQQEQLKQQAQAQHSQQSHQQHSQQPQQSLLLNDATRDQILSLALSGDLAKVLQFTNLALQQGGNGALTLGALSAATRGLPGGVPQQLQDLSASQHVQQDLQQESVSREKVQYQEDKKSKEHGQCSVEPSGASTSPQMESISHPVSGSLTDEDDTKMPSATVVPCRARGMPMDHNFQTATFHIPDDVKHGQCLICSFPACRNRGIKFLYCAYCRDPVAKRNFRNRHGHEDLEQREKETKQDKSGGVKKNSQSKEARKKERKVSSSKSSSSFPRPTQKTGKASGRMEHQFEQHQFVSEQHQFERKGSKKRSISEVSSGGHSGGQKRDRDHRIEAKFSKLGAKRQAAWANLLRNRPENDDGDEMSKWLMQVMAVSDSQKPLSKADTPFGSSGVPSTGSESTRPTGSGESTESQDQSDSGFFKSSPSFRGPVEVSTNSESTRPSGTSESTDSTTSQSDSGSSSSSKVATNGVAESSTNSESTRPTGNSESAESTNQSDSSSSQSFSEELPNDSVSEDSSNDSSNDSSREERGSN